MDVKLAFHFCFDRFWAVAIWRFGARVAEEIEKLHEARRCYFAANCCGSSAGCGLILDLT